MENEKWKIISEKWSEIEKIKFIAERIKEEKL